MIGTCICPAYVFGSVSLLVLPPTQPTVLESKPWESLQPSGRGWFRITYFPQSPPSSSGGGVYRSPYPSPPAQGPRPPVSWVVGVPHFRFFVRSRCLLFLHSFSNTILNDLASNFGTILTPKIGPKFTQNRSKSCPRCILNCI